MDPLLETVRILLDIAKEHTEALSRHEVWLRIETGVIVFLVIMIWYLWERVARLTKRLDLMK